MAKRLIKLTESDLHNIIKESVKRILREDEVTGEPGDDMALGFNQDRLTSVYHSCRREYAQRIIDAINSGNARKLIGRGNAYGDGIYATLRPATSSAYGDSIIELIVPTAVVKPISSKRDGEFCVINPNDIQKARLYR